jgi:hypothetical protein
MCTLQRPSSKEMFGLCYSHYVVNFSDCSTRYSKSAVLNSVITRKCPLREQAMYTVYSTVNNLVSPPSLPPPPSKIRF